MIRALLALVLMLVAVDPLLADSARPPARLADTQLPDPKQEAEAQKLMLELRCLVCQGQSIADSNAEMAGDMRALVRRQIAEGSSPQQVREWLIARYGEYVTYDPPLSAATLPLWITPIAFIVIGLFLARASFKRRKRA